MTKTAQTTFNSKQLLFKELFVGSLIYVVVLSLFNDYTSIVQAKSASTILLASMLLQGLTYLAFMLKSSIISWLRHRKGAAYKLLMFFCVWLVMFLSKFVFIWAVDRVFGDTITIFGFFGILWIVLSVTIIHKAADRLFTYLGDQHSSIT